MNTYNLNGRDLLAAFVREARTAKLTDAQLLNYNGQGPSFERAMYLYGVILSKLDGQEPPFNEGEQVIPMSDIGSMPSGKMLKAGEPLIVKDMVYDRNKFWWIKFENQDFKYPAGSFQRVPVAPLS
jgi:hypothetical protein